MGDNLKIIVILLKKNLPFLYPYHHKTKKMFIDMDITLAREIFLKLKLNNLGT